MQTFLQKHSADVTGVLTGLDRLVIRGTLQQIAYERGMDKCLGVERVLYKDFKAFAQSKSKALVAGTKAFAAERDRPLIYLPSPKVDKEECALGVLREKPIDKGLICVLESVEPCRSFRVRKNQETGKNELSRADRKCAFFYHYAIHPRFGFMNARIQSWLPFTIQICLNGREWLARTMDHVGLRYERDDNTFTWIEDYAHAQTLLDEQVSIDWETELNGIARCLLPGFPSIFTRFEVRYTWTVHESEVATDLVFKDSGKLLQAYRPRVRQAISAFDSADVLRFLGQRRVCRAGVRADFSGEITSSYKRRPEGVRVKHAVNTNSVKVYDKAEQVLRTETTINNPYEFKVKRPKEGGTPSDQKSRYLRKSIDDLGRRVQVSRECNGRYLEALASLSSDETLQDILRPVSSATTLGSSRVRGLRVFEPADFALLAAVNRGEHAINGFRNRDLRLLLDPAPATPREERRCASQVTRRLRILRGHNLAERIPRSHRYRLTARGRVLASAVLTAADASLRALASSA